MQKFCQNCNQPNPYDAVFCRHCAASLQQGFGGQQQQQGTRQQERFGNQPQWNQPQFGGQPLQNVHHTSQGTSGRAIASLILAIAGLLCCGFFTGIPAAILGWLEVTAIKEGRSPQSGLVMAQIGLWGGIIVSILSAIVSVLYFLLVLAGGAF